MKRYITLLPALVLYVCLSAGLQSCKGNKGDGNIAQNDSTIATKTDGEKTSAYTFDPQKPYPYESGVVEYKYTGDFDGKQIITFTDYGRTYRVEEDYVNNVTPSHDKVDQVFIKKGDNFYFYDETEKKGYSINLKDSTHSFQDNLLHDFTTMGIDSTMKKNGYKPSGELDVSGKRCQVYTSADGKSKFCFWNGINVKTDMKLGQQFGYTLEAVNIDKKNSIDEDRFTPPSDVKIMPYDQYMKSETRDKL